MGNEPPRYRVTSEIDGKQLRGACRVAGKSLTVSAGLGGMSGQVGATPVAILEAQLPETLAKVGEA